MEPAAALSLLARLLPVPPFPGSRPITPFQPASTPRLPDLDEARRIIETMRAGRLGGTSWGGWPALPGDALRILRTGAGAGPLDVQADVRWPAGDILDPWWMLDHAREIIVQGDDALALLAGIAGVSCRVLGRSLPGIPDRMGMGGEGEEPPLVACVADIFAAVDCRDPVTGRAITPLELVDRFALWRALIDANRPIVGAFGFARWKQVTTAPMLWGGQSGGTPFARANAASISRLAAGAGLAVWKARVSPRQLRAIEAVPLALHEVEDGFIRSVGLGANCVPPLSIVVDPLGVHYDPSRPSLHEALLAQGGIDGALLARARKLRERIVAHGVSKYGVGAAEHPRRGGDRPHLLVVGQVEDDRSVRYGCSDIRTNAALLEAVRAQAPDAWIVYRPHPDIESGHRPGRIPPVRLAELADEVAAQASISALIASSDQIHVMTSLAGFEALLHGKAVTTWGAPFYAGWGLTDDRSPGWSRRRCNRTLDELIAVTLLLYPRYVDPVTRLPCDAETLIDRLVAGDVPADSWLVRLRTGLGWGKRAVTFLRDRVA